MSELQASLEASNGSEITFQARGMTLKALTFGDKSKPPVLALHGWMDNAASFSALAPLLDQFYVIALDLPGHGRSDHRPVGVAYFHADYALDAVHAANALGLDSFVLMGHSMGGGVATLVAAAVPERIEHLILLDGPGPYTRVASGTARQLGQAIAHSVQPVPPPRRFQNIGDMLARRLLASGDVAPGLLELIVKRNAIRMEEGGDSWWQWTTDHRLKLTSPIGLTSDAVMHVLSDIKAPVLNILASRGVVSEAFQIDQRSAQLNHAKTVTIDGHHHFHLDGAADQTAMLIKDFVAATCAYAPES